MCTSPHTNTPNKPTHLLLHHGFLIEKQQEGKQQHQDPMADVAEHDGKEERKGHDCEHRRVDLRQAMTIKENIYNQYEPQFMRRP